VARFFVGGEVGSTIERPAGQFLQEGPPGDQPGTHAPRGTLQHLVARDQRHMAGGGVGVEPVLDEQVGVTMRPGEDNLHRLRGMPGRAINAGIPGVEDDGGAGPLGKCQQGGETGQQPLPLPGELPGGVMRLGQPRGVEQVVTVDHQEPGTHGEALRNRREELEGLSSKRGSRARPGGLRDRRNMTRRQPTSASAGSVVKKMKKFLSGFWGCSAIERVGALGTASRAPVSSVSQSVFSTRSSVMFFRNKLRRRPQGNTTPVQALESRALMTGTGSLIDVIQQPIYTEPVVTTPIPRPR
jgi:hypothetical protein